MGFDAFTGDRGELALVQAARGKGWRDTMESISVDRSFDRPDRDMANRMSGLQENFLMIFADGRPNFPFHGARTVGGIDRSQRKQVTDTAWDFLFRDIWWTWVDMLDYKGFGWNGSTSDIDEIRCDGVVEYSYEKHDIKVCEGHDASEWRIAEGGKKNVENHNDFHNGAYQHGELCARIQAGDQGDDTAFIQPVPSIPVIMEFFVTPFSLFPPFVSVTVSAPQSYYAYARLLVRPLGLGPFYFARTQDPYGPPGLGLPVGAWRLMRIDEGGQYAHWLGKTDGGPDYWGQDGTFEFRVQVIDEGGNVSDESATEVTMTWPSERPAWADY
jgi:hypothetical protein